MKSGWRLQVSYLPQPGLYVHSALSRCEIVLSVPSAYGSFFCNLLLAFNLDSGEIPHLHVGYTKLEPRLLIPRPVRRSKIQGNLHLYLFILRVTHICQATCTGHKIEG